MKKCFQCGMELNDSAETCPKCGAYQNKAQISTPQSTTPDETSKTTANAEQPQSNVGKVIIFILVGISAILGGLYGYGYWKASDQLKNGQLSIFTAGITIQGMNPISKEGYRNYIMNKTDMPQRLKNFNSTD